MKGTIAQTEATLKTVVSSAAAVAPCLLYLEDIEVLCSAHATGLAASQVYVGMDSYCVAEALHS